MYLIYSFPWINSLAACFLSSPGICTSNSDKGYSLTCCGIFPAFFSSAKNRANACSSLSTSSLERDNAASRAEQSTSLSFALSTSCSRSSPSIISKYLSTASKSCVITYSSIAKLKLSDSFCKTSAASLHMVYVFWTSAAAVYCFSTRILMHSTIAENNTTTTTRDRLIALILICLFFSETSNLRIYFILPSSCSGLPQTMDITVCINGFYPFPFTN